MQNIPQATEHVVPLQSIGELITDALRRFVADEIAATTIVRPSETLSRREVAALFKISLPTLLRRTVDGSIPCTRLGRRVLYERSQIDALLQKSSLDNYIPDNSIRWYRDRLDEALLKSNGVQI